MGSIMNFDSNEDRMAFAEYVSAFLDYERVHHSVDLNGTDLTSIIYTAIEAFESIQYDK